MMYKKYILLSLALFSVQSCIGTNGMDYYSKEAYAERGAGMQDITPPAYTIPPQPMGQMPVPTQAMQTQQSFQTQQQSFTLNNTNNHSSNVSQSRNVNANGNNYMVYLSTLADSYYKHTNYFASKGLNADASLLQAKADSASAGYDVIFETEESFNLPLDKKSIIAQRRQELENIKSNIEILQAMPKEIAIAQASFDCTVLEARNRMYSHTNACSMEYANTVNFIKKNFKSVAKTEIQSSTTIATTELDANGDNSQIINARKALMNAPIAEKQSHGIKHKQELQNSAILKYKNTKSFVVYYSTGDAKLDANAIYSINHAIAFAQDYDQYRIHILGFTDRVASRDYNKSLSQTRANTIRNALIERGISQNLIDVKMFGEDYNAINTRDGVGESFNRRVVIEVEVSGKFDEDTFIMQKSSENIIVE